jgi:hypothetical protein
MSKLENFAYKSPLTKADTPSSQEGLSEDMVDPATPMPRKIPLSDLMSNTPRRQDGGPDVSPEEKVVWKLSPTKILEGVSASQDPNARMTNFLSFLNDDEKKKVIADIVD